MKKILLCFGTRPEAIKMASLYHVLKASTKFQIEVCVTAQHREMLDQVLDFFEIVPDYDLDLMKENQSLNALSSRIFIAIDQVFEISRPDLVLVHGDTTTSTMCALAAFHRGIKVGHVEAGLRTYNKKSPFPEEMNRQITGRIADYHFAPTQQSFKNLILENVSKENIVVTGNTVIDSLIWSQKKLNASSNQDKIETFKKINFNNKVILVTGHRRENFGQGFENICKALLEIAKDNTVEIVYPVHLNPNVQKPVYEILGTTKNIHLIAPLDYPNFVWLMSKSYFIITDSGGVQEEAPTLGKPVLVTRDTTERPEAVLAGTVLLIGTNAAKIVSESHALLNDLDYYHKMQQAHNPYGDGQACKRICEFLIKRI